MPWEVSVVTVRGRRHWSQHRAVRLLHCPSGSPTDRAHLHHPPCRGPCPGACRLGLSCQLLQWEPLRPGVAKPEHGCGPAPPVGSQGALRKVQHMCVFEEQQEFTGCCKAVGPGDWPPGASLGGESRAWPAALPLVLRAGEKEAGRGLEGPEKDPRGGFKGQASVSAWPEAQGSPTAFRELQVLPSTEHARPGGLETVSGSVELGFLEGEEPSLEGGAPAPWGELECAALFEKSYCLRVSRPLGPDSPAVGFVSFLYSMCFPLVVTITSS
ncbi:uncharacterized protein ACBT57_003090 [Dama dama]